jgi:hypothetical protein
MKKWSKVVLSIWLIFFSILLSTYLSGNRIPVAYLMVLLITSLIYFLLTIFEMMKK